MKILALTIALISSTAAIAETPKTNDPQELKKVIAKQEQEIKQLKAREAENASNMEPASGIQTQVETPTATTNKLVENKFKYNKE